MGYDQHKQAISRLADVLLEAGWHVEHAAREDAGFDLLAEKPPYRYVVQVKAANEARRPLLEGLFASAILRARAASRSHNGAPLAVVHAPSISDASLQHLRSFANDFGEGIQWGALDDDGLAFFSANGLERVMHQRKRQPKAPSSPQQFDAFSDLGQWMLKVLLSHLLPSELQVMSPNGSPVSEPIANAASLSDVAAVSVASAARLVSALRDDHFCEGPPINLIRIGELLARWRAAGRKRPLDLRAKWIFPSLDSNRQLEDALRQINSRGNPGRACLGLFAACDRLGYPFVSGVSPHLYLENVSAQALERFGLRAAEPGERADVFVREPRFPESVFRGARECEGVLVADVLQCWLDVSDYPARGLEMSEYLYQKVIEPFILAKTDD